MELISHPRPPATMIDRATQVGESELLWLGSAPFAVTCRPAQRSGDLKLIAALDGAGALIQEGRRAALAPGQFTWLDADAPFELAMSAGRRLIVRMPGHVVRSRHPEIDLCSAIPRGIDHAGERVVAALLRQLAHDGPALSDDSCAVATSTLLESIGLCARASSHDVALVRVERAMTQLALRLGEPGLDASEIAHQQGVSRRYLDGLVRRVTGSSLATQIRIRRLERAAEDLRDHPEQLTAEIARRWGFVDASHFTRKFRAHYGITPTAFRARGARATRS